MLMNLLKKHAALIVAFVGFISILFGPDYLGLVEDQKQFAEMVLAVLTTIGVGIGEHIEYDRGDEMETPDGP